MNLLSWLRGERQPAVPRVEPEKRPPIPRGFSVPPELAARATVTPRQAADPFRAAEHPPGVLPAGRQPMAMDDAISTAGTWSSVAVAGYASAYDDALVFLGFAYLAQLAQRPEYRRISEIIAVESTRRWIKLTASGEEDKTDRIKVIDAALERFRVRDVIRECAEHDGFFGRGHIFPDLGDLDDTELATPIGNGRDKATLAKVGKGKLRGFKTIEAVWVYPTGYNSMNPLAPDWYKPTAWFVQGRKVHASRLLTLVGREVPDLLKPAYSFGGLSMTQMARPYVDNWLRTRQAVSDLIASFSVSGIKIDMASALNAPDASGIPGNGLFNRVALFNNMRGNAGTMVLNKASPNDPAEEFFNVSTPLGTLDALQAQSQEQMAAVSGIPLVKLLGISPAGLNASSEGEIRVFYDAIHAYQERLFREPLSTIIGLIQVNEFGDVDPDITFSFEPLWSMDEKAAADVKLVEAQTDAVLIEAGALMPEEVRKRVASDPDTAYPGLDLSLELNPPRLGEQDDLPEVPEPGEREEA